MTDKTKEALIAGLFGLAGTLLSAIIAWARDFSSSSERSRNLEEAIKRTNFWDGWLRLQLQIVSSAEEIAALKAKVLQQLTASAALIEKMAKSERARQAELHTAFDRKSIPRLRRWLLLYKPPRAIAWIPRLFFYIFLIETPVWVTWGARDTDLRSELPIMVLGFMFWMLVFHALSVWFEKPRGN